MAKRRAWTAGLENTELLLGTILILNLLKLCRKFYGRLSAKFPVVGTGTCERSAQQDDRLSLCELAHSRGSTVVGN